MFSSNNSQVSNDANYIEDVFSTYLYTGNATARSISNGIDLSGKGGLVWTKSRSLTLSYHYLGDTARGASKYLNTNSPAAQVSTSDITSFNSDGYSLNSDVNGGFNNNGATFASWTFRKQPKFFDVVTYTGTGSARTIAHALGSTPGCIIVKRTDTSADWAVYHVSTGNQYATALNDVLRPVGPISGFWNSTDPTSTNFTVGNNATTNASGGTYVAYIFASNSGGFGLTGTDNVISCGSFTTNGSGNATVTLGYEPQWVLIRNITRNTVNWHLVDNMRGMPTSGQGRDLYPNTSDAETGNSLPNPTATGFTVTGVADFGGADTYIYIAIRRGPMKVPTDATKVFVPVTRTGTGAVATVTGASFPPDLGISLARSAIREKAWHDRLRGATNQLISSFTSAEYNDTGSVTSFNMNGWSLGSDGAGNSAVNSSGVTYANYFFRRAPNFFDEVCDTGTGAAHTITHNLAAVPELIIRKGRSGATQWESYVSALANTEKLVLNSTNAKATDTTAWNSTTPTSTVFTVGTGANVNTNAATYVTYLFATLAGVSKVGSYTGNGTTQTINCGFTGGARFVLIKRTDATGDWYVYDTARGMTTLTDPYLLLNSTAAESATLGSVTTVSTGFAVNASILAAINTNAASYVFLAIA